MGGVHSTSSSTEQSYPDELATTPLPPPSPSPPPTPPQPHDWSKPCNMVNMLQSFLEKSTTFAEFYSSPKGNKSEIIQITSFKLVENIVIGTINNCSKLHIICGYSNGYIRIWNFAAKRTPECVLTLKTPSGTTCLDCFDGTIGSDYEEDAVTTIISGHADGKIRVWDLTKTLAELDKTSEPKPILDTDSSCVNCLRVLDNIIVAAGSSNTIKSWDRTTYSLMNILHTTSPTTCCYTNNSNIIFGDAFGRVINQKLPENTYDQLKLFPPRIVAKHNYAVTCIDSIGNTVISGDENGEIKINRFDIPHTINLKRSSTITAIVASTSIIVSGHGDGRIKIWDITTGECIQEILAHNITVTCLEIYADSVIISGSHDGSVKVWSNE